MLHRRRSRAVFFEDLDPRDRFLAREPAPVSHAGDDTREMDAVVTLCQDFEDGLERPQLACIRILFGCLMQPIDVGMELPPMSDEQHACEISLPLIRAEPQKNWISADGRRHLAFVGLVRLETVQVAP
jgi:hypothetical protein